MTQWEFTYVDLWMGDAEVGSVVAAQRVIQQLGRDGWEPVGEVRFEFKTPRLNVPTQARELMFKRPLR